MAYLGVQAAFLVDCISHASLKIGICRNLYSITIFQSAFNVASDIFVLTLPIPRILRLHIQKRQKMSLLVIFLAGLVACGVSIARLVFTAKTLNRPGKSLVCRTKRVSTVRATLLYFASSCHTRNA